VWATRNLRLIDSCVTQLKAQGASRTCNESNEEEEATRAVEDRGVADADRDGNKLKGRDLSLKERSTEGQNLALTVLVVPNSLDSGQHTASHIQGTISNSVRFLSERERERERERGGRESERERERDRERETQRERSWAWREVCRAASRSSSSSLSLSSLELSDTKVYER